ncbi:MAG: 2-amino-4-hydroxy-6-hydroxymethyldihydropteridine diphosphokinase [Candidatus Azotimanducaceae bacterium]|jgi:2-amino-4-hydroxy-6-hydroxymethyldihydropteridine diphosphokinase
MPVIAHVALGSNLGDSLENLSLAAGHLHALTVGGFWSSSVWRSEPEGFMDSVQDFCNAVVRLEVEGTAGEFLKRLQFIEANMGQSDKRRTSGGYESRRIDLDLIDFGGQVLNESGLQLPHPRAFKRRFVLLPLQEISPAFMFPDQSEGLMELINLAVSNPMTNMGPLAV